jgi:DNA-binding GntR family transcriptional regulator
VLEAQLGGTTSTERPRCAAACTNSGIIEAIVDSNVASTSIRDDAWVSARSIMASFGLSTGMATSGLTRSIASPNAEQVNRMASFIRILTTAAYDIFPPIPEGSASSGTDSSCPFEREPVIKKDLAVQLAPRVIDMIRARSMTAGEPLREQAFAKALGVSRSPIRRVFAMLAEWDLAFQEPNRGYFLKRDAGDIQEAAFPLASDPFEDFYLRVVDDILGGEIPAHFFEAQLLRRYEVPRGQLLKVLNRLAGEAMVERNPGQGWSLKDFVHNTQAHIQSYRFRMAIEPAALLEPGYRVDQAAFARVRQQQQALIDGEIHSLSRAQLFQAGARFHELIVHGSGNVFFIDAIRQQNQLRRFMGYRSNVDRSRLMTQCLEHIHLLDLIESGRREEAAQFLWKHLDEVGRIKTQQDALPEAGEI